MNARCKEIKNVVPAKQDNYTIAVTQAFEKARMQPEASFCALGARPLGRHTYELPVLDSTFTIDMQSCDMVFRMNPSENDSCGAVGVFWRILALHYLCGAPASGAQPMQWATFSDFQDIRGYESVYKGRVIGRFCATAGRTPDTFRRAATANGGVPVPLGDMGYHFQVFPKTPLRIVYYAGDGELPPDASFLYPDNILALLPLEDVIVLAEGLVSRLQGKGWR